MNAPALRRATVPTSRAIAWSPLLVVGGVLLAVATALRLLDSPPGSVLVLGAATMAAVLVFSLRDPAAALLAAVPISRFQRRAMRLALVGTVALPLWLLVADVLPGNGVALGPLLALAASGVAVATWIPVDRDISVAAAVPLLWASAAELFGGSVGPANDVLTWWQTDPWWVTATAVTLVLLGRNR